MTIPSEHWNTRQQDAKQALRLLRRQQDHQTRTDGDQHFKYLRVALVIKFHEPRLKESIPYDAQCCSSGGRLAG